MCHPKLHPNQKSTKWRYTRGRLWLHLMIKWLLCANELPHGATKCSVCFFVPSPTGTSLEASLNYTVGIINWANLQPFIFWQLWPSKAKSQRWGEVLPTSQLQIAVNCKWWKFERERERESSVNRKSRNITVGCPLISTERRLKEFSM